MHHLHGVATLEDLAAAGISKDRLANMPGYERVAHGRYALPGARRDVWFHAALAISIAGEDARLTAATALFAMGILDDPPEPAFVVVPEGKGSRKRRDFDVRRSCHLPSEVVMVEDLPLVPVAYALTDFARDSDDASVAFALSRCLGLRLTKLDAVRAITDERGKFPGSGRMRRVLDDFGDVETHSRRERALRKELNRIGLTPSEEQLLLCSPDGRRLRLADIPFPDVRLDVEVDGPHHFLPAQQAKDRSVDRQIRGIDWDVLRVTVYEIDADVEGAAQTVKLAYEARARLLGLAAA